MATIERRNGREGKTAYRVKVRLYGYPAMSATFDRLTDARAWASKTETEIRQGRHTSVASRKVKLNEAIDRYIKERNVDRSSQYRLGWWRKQLGKTPLWAIKAQTVRQAKSDLAAMVGPSTVNRYLSALSAVFREAVQEWGWISENPVRGVSRRTEPSTPVTADDILTDNQARRLLEECRKSRNRDLYPVVMIALYCGARKGEIVALRWRDIDLKRRSLTFRETKNSTTRVIRLPDDVHRLLSALPKADYNELVFSRDIRTAWEYARSRAGLDGFRFHDLRHSAASYLAEDGRTVLEIAAVLGHKTLEMAKRYSHFRPEHNAAVLESMNKRKLGGRSEET